MKKKIAVVKGTVKAGEDADVYLLPDESVEVIWQISGDSVKFVGDGNFRTWASPSNTFVRGVEYINEDDQRKYTEERERYLRPKKKATTNAALQTLQDLDDLICGRYPKSNDRCTAWHGALANMVSRHAHLPVADALAECIKDWAGGDTELAREHEENPARDIDQDDTDEIMKGFGSFPQGSMG